MQVPNCILVLTDRVDRGDGVYSSTGETRRYRVTYLVAPTGPSRTKTSGGEVTNTWQWDPRDPSVRDNLGVTGRVERLDQRGRVIETYALSVANFGSLGGGIVERSESYYLNS